MPYARKRSSYTGWTETMIIVWGEEEGVPPPDWMGIVSQGHLMHIHIFQSRQVFHEHKIVQQRTYMYTLQAPTAARTEIVTSRL